MTLGVMSLDKMLGAFDDIGNAVHHLSESPMVQLLKYFENNWILNIELWNVSRSDSHTNNTCEGSEYNLSNK